MWLLILTLLPRYIVTSKSDHNFFSSVWAFLWCGFCSTNWEGMVELIHQTRNAENMLEAVVLNLKLTPFDWFCEHSHFAYMSKGKTKISVIFLRPICVIFNIYLHSLCTCLRGCHHHDNRLCCSESIEFTEV